MSKLKSKTIKLLILFSILIMIATLGETEVKAASKKWKKACKSYKTFLAKNVSKFEIVELDFETQNSENYKKSSHFMLVDLDKNGVPELVTLYNMAYKQSRLHIFTYKKGKVIPVKDSNGNIASIDVSTNAAGYYKIYKCKKKHLHVEWNGGNLGYDYTVYRMKKGKLQKYLKHTQDDLIGKTTYKKNEKVISKKKYESLTKKCKEAKNQFLLENTKKNRKKYVK